MLRYTLAHGPSNGHTAYPFGKNIAAPCRPYIIRNSHRIAPMYNNLSIFKRNPSARLQFHPHIRSEVQIYTR